MPRALRWSSERLLSRAHVTTPSRCDAPRPLAVEDRWRGSGAPARAGAPRSPRRSRAIACGSPPRRVMATPGTFPQKRGAVADLAREAASGRTGGVPGIAEVHDLAARCAPRSAAWTRRARLGWRASRSSGVSSRPCTLRAAGHRPRSSALPVLAVEEALAASLRHRLDAGARAPRGPRGSAATPRCGAPSGSSGVPRGTSSPEQVPASLADEGHVEGCVAPARWRGWRSRRGWGPMWMRAWVRVWLWKSKTPVLASASISSQESSAPSPDSRSSTRRGGRAPASHVVPGRSGAGPGAKTMRPGTRKTIPFIPYRRSRGWPDAPEAAAAVVEGEHDRAVGSRAGAHERVEVLVGGERRVAVLREVAELASEGLGLQAVEDEDGHVAAGQRTSGHELGVAARGRGRAGPPRRRGRAAPACGAASGHGLGQHLVVEGFHLVHAGAHVVAARGGAGARGEGFAQGRRRRAPSAGRRPAPRDRPAGTRRPVTPSDRTSRQPSTAVETMAFPAAIASNRASGVPS